MWGTTEVYDIFSCGLLQKLERLIGFWIMKIGIFENFWKCSNSDLEQKVSKIKKNEKCTSIDNTEYKRI